MTDDTIIDASAAFANKAGKTEKARKSGESHGASPDKLMKQARLPRYSGAQLRENLSSQLPKVKEARRGMEKLGRKHSYTRERFMAVINRMGAGETQTEALQAEGLAYSTFHDWLESGGGDAAEAKQCRDIFARAKIHLADMAFNEALEAPRKLYRMVVGTAEEPGVPVDSATVGAVKLYSDSLKWYAGKMNPAAYGESKDNAPTVNVTNNSLTIDSRSLDAGQRDQLRTLLLSTSKAPVIDG